ncbi:MAG: chloride channel protein [Ruminococcaceae bacterium]|nr:chloride channel protein [Oscillospiraceae bacterium]
MIRDRLKQIVVYIKVFFKWTVVALAVGLTGGVVGSVFHMAIDQVTHVRAENGWILCFLPIGGLLIAALYGVCKKYGKIDTNRVLESVRKGEKIPFVMAPLIFLGTVITHFVGGSAGREGAALQLGGSIGYRIGSLFHLKKEDLHIVVMAGMSSVFAALFGTPLTALFFSLEVTSVGVMYYAALWPCGLAALIGSSVARWFGIGPVKFANVIQTVSVGVVVKVVILAVLCALVCILFCLCIKKCEHCFEKYLPNRYIRAAVGGTLVLLLTILVGEQTYNGAGMDTIVSAMNGVARPEAFALKILFTVITISAGFKGGEIVPTFFIGSTFGCVIGALLGLDPGFGAAIGFVGLFCGVVNCPVASVMLAAEVFGAESILLFAIVCGVTYMMSGYCGLYSSQKIMYSKLEAKYINQHTN